MLPQMILICNPNFMIDNVVEFSEGHSRRTYPIEGVPPIKMDRYDPTFLFFEHASTTGRVGLVLVDPSDTSRLKPVAYNKNVAYRLRKMYQTAIGLNVFRKLMAIQEGDLTRIYSRPKQQTESDEAIDLANRNLDSSVDPDRVFLTAYERWDRKFLEEDGGEHDEFTLRGMQRDTDLLAGRKRAEGKRAYSPEDLKVIIKRVFNETDQIYDAQTQSLIAGWAGRKPGKKPQR